MLSIHENVMVSELMCIRVRVGDRMKVIGLSLGWKQALARRVRVVVRDTQLRIAVTSLDSEV